MAATLVNLRDLLREVGERAERVKKLPRSVVPDKMVDAALGQGDRLARRRSLRVSVCRQTTRLCDGRDVSGESTRDEVDVEHLSVPRETAARLAGLSLRQVDYWAETGLLAPTTDRRLSPGNRVRLYGFVDLLALLVAAELKSRKVSLQHIRTIVDHLRSRGYDSPLTELKFATLKGRVYFQHDDGSWEGDIRPDQLVMHEVLNLRPLRQRIESATRRRDDQIGQVERRRGVKGSKPVIAGTRLPVETVRRYLEAGRTIEQIVESFPVLTPADVEAVRASTVA